MPRDGRYCAMRQEPVRYALINRLRNSQYKAGSMSVKHDLFVYGTLAFDGVLQALLGHVPDKEQVSVSGYVARTIHLEGWEPFPVLLESQEHCVAGHILKDLSETDFIKLDCYEFTDREYYFRKALIIEGRDNVYFYEPAVNLFALGQLGEVWDTSNLDPSIEFTYVNTLVPNFKKENPDIFG